MKYYNVFLYQSCPSEENLEGYPDTWVWKIEECSENDIIPIGAQRMNKEEIRNYKQSQKNIINNFINTKVSSATLVDKKIKGAAKGVKNIIDVFVAENIVMGITQSGKSKLIANVFRDAIFYSQTGSLYECLEAIDLIEITPEMSPFLTEVRKTELKNKILALIGAI